MKPYDPSSIERVSRLLAEHDGELENWLTNAAGARDYCDARAHELIDAYLGEAA